MDTIFYTNKHLATNYKMKQKIIFTSLIIFFTINIANSQIDFGIKAGTGLNNILHYHPDAGISTFQFKYILTYNAGIFSHIQLTKKISIQSEIIFNKKGNSTQYYIDTLRIFTDNNSTIIPINDIHKPRFDYYYIDIPIFFKYNFNKYFGINVGISNNFFIIGKTKSNIKELDSERITISNKYNFGFITGFYLQPYSKLSFYLNFNNSLLPYNVGENGFLYKDFHYGFQFSVSYNLFSTK